MRAALAVPLVFIAGFLVAGSLLTPASNPALRASVVGAFIWLVSWYFALVIRRARALDLTVALRKQHWIQACAHSSIFLYWSTEWPQVAAWAPLIFTQLLFAYSVDILLAWSRRGRYALGFGPFPIIGSINLFLWFKPEWFHLQLAMVALGMFAKEFLCWERDGRRTHIFNPSSFPLAVFSLALLATGLTDITSGYDVATLLDAPYMYLLIFIVALPGQFFFGVTTMTMSAIGTTYLFSLIYYRATGTYFFPDTFIPIAVFLGMHLLFTDPSTAPRTDIGRIVYGIMYAGSVIALFALLERFGMPSFYDKLLGVPLLNLVVRGIDRLAVTDVLRRLDVSAALARWRVAGRRKNVALISIWCGAFLGVNVMHVDMPNSSGTTALHSAVQHDRLTMVRLLLGMGANPTAVDKFGKTPLASAAMSGNGPILGALVHAGADPNATTPGGLTMLMLAARSSTAATQALLVGGASVDARTVDSGETALMWATRARNAQTVQLLLNAGADPNVRDREGRRALTIAAADGDREVMRLLIAGGADSSRSGREQVGTAP